MAHPASVPSRVLLALCGSALLAASGCSSIHMAPGPDAGAPDALVVPPDAWSADDAPRPDEPDAAFVELPRCGSGPVPPTAGIPCLGGDCGVLATQEIDPPHFRNDRPSIAVDASGSAVVLYTIAERGYHLYIARRGADGAFASSPLPPSAADGALAITSDGCEYAHLNDGAFGSGLYRIDGELAQLVHYRRDRMVGGGRLVIGPEGSLHAIGYDESDGSGFLARWANGYTERALPGTVGSFSLPGGLAIDASGTVHAAWQSATSGGALTLGYVRGDGAPEVIATLGSGLALWGPSVDVVPHDDGTVHVLYGGLGSSVALATRGPTWTTRTLFEGEQSSTCPGTPTDGATCETHDLQWAVLGIVSSRDGRALGIVSRNQRDSISRANCMGWPGGGPPPGCTFAEVSHTSSSALHAVVIDGGEVTTREISPTGGGRIGTVALGPDGHVHVATYDQDAAVQYVEIGPVD